MVVMSCAHIARWSVTATALLVSVVAAAAFKKSWRSFLQRLDDAPVAPASIR
jgi:hypothetical protein